MWEHSVRLAFFGRSLSNFGNSPSQTDWHMLQHNTQLIRAAHAAFWEFIWCVAMLLPKKEVSTVSGSAQEQWSCQTEKWDSWLSSHHNVSNKAYEQVSDQGPVQWTTQQLSPSCPWYDFIKIWEICISALTYPNQDIMTCSVHRSVGHSVPYHPAVK